MKMIFTVGFLSAVLASSAIAETKKTTTTTSTKETRQGALEEERVEDRDTDIIRSDEIQDEKPIRKTTTTKSVDKSDE